LKEKIDPKTAKGMNPARRKRPIRPIKKESVMTDENQVLREHALEWIAAGLVAIFIFSGIVFYSFSVDVRSISATQQSVDGKASHRL
jgi:hypothetical protein